MFTGIIEATGRVENIEKEGTNILFTMSCPFTKELKIDQSISHDGCCLTVYDIDNQQYKIAAIHETLEKTNLGNWYGGQFGTLCPYEWPIRRAYRAGACRPDRSCKIY